MQTVCFLCRTYQAIRILCELGSINDLCATKERVREVRMCERGWSNDGTREGIAEMRAESRETRTERKLPAGDC
jgi:hypothetical protein